MTFLVFDPEVWGTVSDWFMVIVTTITAYYLYRTLKSQKEVQITQNKLFEIESIRFRESIKPSLKYTVLEEEAKTDKKNETIFTIKVENENSNFALDLVVDVQEHSNIARIIIAPIRKEYLKLDGQPYYIHFLLQDNTKTLNFLNFSVTYSDISGTKYKQRLFGILELKTPEINAYLPEIIN